MMPAAVRFENVCFSRGDKRILDGVSWTMEKGAHSVLFGPNGSGKTTLLRIATGYLWPSEGEVWVLGKHLGEFDVRELRKKIGWVSSSLFSLVHDEDPVLEIVLSGKFGTTRLWDSVSSSDEKKAAGLLGFLGLSGFEKNLFGVLSQGERQKVLIARSLMLDPGLLVLDEPCSGLDIASRERFLKRLDDLTGMKNGPTVLLVTHHVEEITPGFGKILMLKDGRVVGDGACSRLVSSEKVSQVLGMRVTIKKRGKRFFSEY